MAFAKLDTTVLNHAKFARISLSAIGLYALGLLHCMDQLTDGKIDKNAPSIVIRRGLKGRGRWTVEAEKELVEIGLWIDRGDHYEVHDYLDWNPTAAQIKADREASRERMRKRRSSGERSGERPGERSGEQVPRSGERSRQDVDRDVEDSSAPHGVRANKSGSTEHRCKHGASCPAWSIPLRADGLTACTDHEGRPHYTWPSDEIKRASVHAGSRWLPGREPYKP